MLVCSPEPSHGASQDSRGGCGSQAQDWGPLPQSPHEEWGFLLGKAGRNGSYLQVTAAVRVPPKDASNPASVPSTLYNPWPVRTNTGIESPNTSPPPPLCKNTVIRNLPTPGTSVQYQQKIKPVIQQHLTGKFPQPWRASVTEEKLYPDLVWLCFAVFLKTKSAVYTVSQRPEKWRKERWQLLS